MAENKNTMQLYEKKILSDEEFPIQMFLNSKKRKIFSGSLA